MLCANNLITKNKPWNSIGCRCIYRMIQWHCKLSKLSAYNVLVGGVDKWRREQKSPGLVVRSIGLSFLILIILFVVTTIVCLQASKRTAVHFNDFISPWLQNRYFSYKDKKKMWWIQTNVSGNAYRISQSVSIIAIFVQTVANKRDFSHSNK